MHRDHTAFKDFRTLEMVVAVCVSPQSEKPVAQSLLEECEDCLKMSATKWTKDRSHPSWRWALRSGRFVSQRKNILLKGWGISKKSSFSMYNEVKGCSVFISAKIKRFGPEVASL